MAKTYVQQLIIHLDGYPDYIITGGGILPTRLGERFSFTYFGGDPYPKPGQHVYVEVVEMNEDGSEGWGEIGVRSK